MRFCKAEAQRADMAAEPAGPAAASAVACPGAGCRRKNHYELSLDIRRHEVKDEKSRQVPDKELLMRRMLSKLLALFVVSGIPAKVKATSTPFDGAANYTIAPETAAPSLIAALVMGARGYQNYAPPAGWKTSFQTLCESETTRLSWAGHPQDPDRAWPSNCDTWGAASTIKMRTGLDWTIQIYNDDQYGLLIAKMLEAVVSWHSPVVIPLWGQADHWAVFFRISGTDNPPKKRVIEKIWFEDGLEIGRAHV